MIILYEPGIRELWFRKTLLEDQVTMEYNHAWGGTIPFPEADWEKWYDYWLINHNGKRFYRYLLDQDNGKFIGEIAYHFDETRQIWLADIIILAENRRKGYGTQGLRLLCDAAVHNGIDVLWDDIAIDNPGINLFLREGFTEEYRTDDIIMLKKELKQID